MKRFCAFAPCVLLLFASSASAQAPDEVFRGNVSFLIPPSRPQVLLNAPYSGEQIDEVSQTQEDGTQITRAASRKVWRDSQGRVRTERTFTSVHKNVPTLVEITDPVAGYELIMDDITRTAHRVRLGPEPQEPPRHPAPLSATYHPGSSVGYNNGSNQYQDLEPKTIEGVLVDGRRFSREIPAGAQGNDRPFTATSEYWFSGRLRLTVLAIESDPYHGVTTTHKIANLSTREPAPALFTVPPGYAVVDETTGSSFTIQWGEQ